MSSRTRNMLLIATLLAFVVFAFVFQTFPWLDIWFSDLFRSNGRFWPKNWIVLESVRTFASVLALSVPIIAAIMFTTNLIFKPATQIPNRVWAYMCTVYILGPALLVNLLLKGYWGRARPQNIPEFGGARPFTPPLTMSDSCPRNCSFVSGEASSIMAGALVICLVFLPGLGKNGRIALVSGALFVSTLSSFLRIAKGRHFLSDILFAADFMALIAIVLFFAFGIHKFAHKISLSMVLPDMLAMLKAARRRPARNPTTPVDPTSDIAKYGISEKL